MPQNFAPGDPLVMQISELAGPTKLTNASSPDYSGPTPWEQWEN